MSVRMIRQLPRGALAIVPLLMLPILFGAFYLAVSSRSAGGTVMLVFGTICIAWYLLGGAIALQEIMRAIRSRKEVAALRAELEAAETSAFVLDRDGMVLAQNCLALAQFGDLIGRRIQEVIAKTSVEPERFWEAVLSRLDEAGATTVELGADYCFELSRHAGADIQFWRIAPSRKLQEENRSSMDQFMCFDELPVALLLLDNSALVLRMNSSACAMVGRDLSGHALSTILEGPGRPLKDWVADVGEGRLSGAVEVLRMRGESGAERFLQATLRRSDAGGVVAILSDASALKRLEAQFVQSQKMQAIGQLAGGIAHDFNNVLTAISGHCDLLMLRHDKGDPDYADLEQINQNTNRAAALVDQLLAYSRKQTLKLRILDLRDCLSDLTHLLNRLVSERVVLTFQHDPKLHLIRADKRQLEQVIMNLVVNARDAMPDGGDITISTMNIHVAAGKAGEKKPLVPGDYVCVEVQDQGSGIAPELTQKIFEPFFSTKRTGEGTGLGLSTAYGIVKQTGGYIFCESEVGVGSRFSLYFPAHIGAEVEPPESEPESGPLKAFTPARLTEPTVLLVEDEAPVRAFASRALQLQGCRVLEAASGEEALEILSDQRLLVDVFVTDVVMPGMDGPTWVRAALRDRPRTRVIFMSGYSEEVFSNEASPVPGASFLAKPFSLTALTALVGKQLETNE